MPTPPKPRATHSTLCPKTLYRYSPREIEYRGQRYRRDLLRLDRRSKDPKAFPRTILLLGAKSTAHRLHRFIPTLNYSHADRIVVQAAKNVVRLCTEGVT